MSTCAVLTRISICVLLVLFSGEAAVLALLATCRFERGKQFFLLSSASTRDKAVRVLCTVYCTCNLHVLYALVYSYSYSSCNVLSCTSTM